MRTPHYTGQFRRDVKRAKRRGKDMEKLRRGVRFERTGTHSDLFGE